MERDYALCTQENEKFKVVEFANLLNFLYLTGLRGEEGMKVDVAGFLKHLESAAAHPEYPHVVVPILGRLKGEQGERYHMMIIARRTQSGLGAGKWADTATWD